MKEKEKLQEVFNNLLVKISHHIEVDGHISNFPVTEVLDELEAIFLVIASIKLNH